MEMFSQNPVMRARGARRAAGLSAVSAASFGGISSISAILAGLNSDQKQAMESNETVAPWETGTGKIYLSGLENGKIVTIPLAFVDPYSYLSRIGKTALNSLNKGENEKQFSGYMYELSSFISTEQLQVLNEFFQKQIAGKVVEWRSVCLFTRLIKNFKNE